MEHFDVLIVGGGIAGLSTAWHLSRSGGLRTCLLEREKVLASHASGRNAAIFRHLDHDATGVQLALRSRELLGDLGEEGELLRRTGTLFVGAQEQLRPMAELARRFGLEAELAGEETIASRAPLLAGGDARCGLWVRDDGVLDVHALIEALARQARDAGARTRTGAAVAEILCHRGRVSGVRLDDGGELHAEIVVVAAGAWAAGVSATCGAVMPLVSRRRHLAMLVVDEAPQAWSPVVWRVDEEVYFRPESGGVLASPCDEEPWPAGDPPCSQDQMVRLAELLSRVAPSLARARVRRAWACLRTFATDRSFVAGEDPRCRGLFWIAGLGGRGMSCGLALGEIVAARIRGQPHSMAQALSPARLLDPANG